MPAVRTNALNGACGWGAGTCTFHRGCPIIQISCEGIPYAIAWQIKTGRRHTRPLSQWNHFTIRVTNCAHILFQPTLAANGNGMIFVSINICYGCDILARIGKIGVFLSRNRIVSTTKSNFPFGHPAVISTPTIDDFNSPCTIYRTTDKLGEGLVRVIYLGHVDRIGRVHFTICNIYTVINIT